MKITTITLLIAMLLIASGTGIRAQNAAPPAMQPGALITQQQPGTNTQVMTKKPPVTSEKPARKGGSPTAGDYSDSASNVSAEELQRALGNNSYNGVLPDAPTAVQVSASDVNRVTCSNGMISDVIYSQEKGVTVKYSGKDAFIKFQVVKEGGKGSLLYSNTPTEIYFVCGDQVYTIIALPKRMPAQQIRLANTVIDRIKQNKEYFADMPYEQRIATIIQRAYKDEFEDSWTVQGINRNIDDFSNYQITHFRNVVIDGEGIILKEYHVRFTDAVKYPDGGRIDEKMFLVNDLTSNTVAIALDKTIIKPNDLARVFIIEAKKESRGVRQ
jgi:conjugal transfer pilus assembly protein TraK